MPKKKSTVTPPSDKENSSQLANVDSKPPVAESAKDCPSEALAKTTECPTDEFDDDPDALDALVAAAEEEK